MLSGIPQASLCIWSELYHVSPARHLFTHLSIYSKKLQLYTEETENQPSFHGSQSIIPQCLHQKERQNADRAIRRLGEQSPQPCLCPQRCHLTWILFPLTLGWGGVFTVGPIAIVSTDHCLKSLKCLPTQTLSPYKLNYLTHFVRVIEGWLMYLARYGLPS